MSNDLMIIDEKYKNKYVSLSNALIQAREKTSLMESKIELLAIYRLIHEMKVKKKKDVDGKEYKVHFVEISAREIRELTDKTGGSIYDQILEASTCLKQKIFIYKDVKNNQFRMDNLYGEVIYDNGKLMIEFNPNTESLFLDLQDKFTKIRLDIAFKFQTNGGFQLYKLLKSYVYELPPIDINLSQEEQPALVKEYSINELRLQLGYVDLDQPDIKREGAKKFPDADKMAALEKKPKYKRWSDFYSRVLETGMKEVNAISDIYIDQIGKRKGAHGKIEGTSIRVQHNKAFYLRNEKKGKKVEKKIILNEEQIDDFIDDMRDFIAEPIKTKELKTLAELSNYNIDKIKKAYKIADSSKTEISNLFGFMKKAIEDDYELPVSKKSSKKSNINFTQRNYDTDELENILLNTNI